MVCAGRERLIGRVEVDEAFVGGQEEGARGRDAEGKTAVLVAVEGESGKSVESFILDYMEPGALVVTDALSVYDHLQAMGFVHRPHVVSTGGKEALQELDHVHLIISLLKRWQGGTHQGGVTPSHLQAYLDEFSFRFNRRLSQHRGKLFYRLMQQAVTTRPPAVKSLCVPKPQDLGGT